MAMKYRSNRHVVYACTYHVVWCPKYRRALLTGAVELRLKELVQQAVAETTAEIIEMEVMPDHVHLLVSVDPQYGVHRLVKAHQGPVVTGPALRVSEPEKSLADALDP
jgi:putative transposase